MTLIRPTRFREILYGHTCGPVSQADSLAHPGPPLLERKPIRVRSQLSRLTTALFSVKEIWRHGAASLGQERRLGYWQSLATSLAAYEKYP